MVQTVSLFLFTFQRTDFAIMVLTSYCLSSLSFVHFLQFGERAANFRFFLLLLEAMFLAVISFENGCLKGKLKSMHAEEAPQEDYSLINCIV